MTTQVRVRPENNPATLRPDWLPESEFPELEELRHEHQTVLAEWDALRYQRMKLEESYEAEDTQHANALREAYSDGVEKPKLPKRTPPREREQKLGALNEQTRTRREYVWTLISEIVAAVQRHEDQWCKVLHEREGAAQAHVEELRRQVAEAEAAAAIAPKLRVWVQRTALNRDGWHINFAELVKPVRSLVEIANSGINGMPSPALLRERALAAGGQDAAVNAVPDYSDETIDYSSAEYQKQLDRTLGDFNRRQRATETGDMAS